MNIVTENDVIEVIKNVCENIEEVPVSISFSQSGLLDSMQLVNLIFELESTFDISFDIDNLKLETVDSPIKIADTINNMKGFANISLREMIDNICLDNKDKNSIVFDDEILTYEELHTKIKSVAVGFQKNGIKKGTHVVIQMNNCLEYILSYFALFYIGAIPVPINTRWNIDEIYKVIKDSDSQYIICDDKESKKVKEIVAKLKEINYCINNIFFVGNVESYDKGINFDDIYLDIEEISLEKLEGSDVAMISYTSGTTGKPKGVLLKHNDIVKISMYTTRIWATDKDKSFSIAPLYSAQGFLSLIINFAIENQFKMISSFNPNDILKEISRKQESIIHTQPTMWTLLLNSKVIEFANFDNLSELVVSGSLCSPELAKRIEEKLHCELLNAYGLIEGTSVVTMTRKGDSQEIRYNTVGRPIPGVDIKIVDKDRNLLKHGEIGELAVRGYNMLGYYKNEKKTKEIIDEDGWLYTGDLAKYYDDENIAIVGRCKDMVIRGGFNVYPSDIEEVILQIPKVQMTAVVGKTHEVLGEELVAFIVPKAGETLKKSDVTRYLFSHIANYKQPDKIYFISDMPIILAGKIDKKILSDWAENGIPEDKKMLFE